MSKTRAYDYTITKEESPVFGYRWVVRNMGVRLGSAATKHQAEQLLASIQKDQGNG